MEQKSTSSQHAGNPAIHSQWMLSGAVAERLGIKTSTLKKWRYLGKGPAVWRRTGDTVVFYLTGSVLEFEETWGGPSSQQTT